MREAKQMIRLMKERLRRRLRARSSKAWYGAVQKMRFHNYDLLEVVVRPSIRGQILRRIENLQMLELIGR